MNSNEIRDVAEVATASGLFGAFVAGAAVVAQQRGGWGVVVQAACAGAVVGSLVSMGIYDMKVSVAFSGGIIGLSAIAADYILAAVRAMGAMFAKDPLTMIGRVLDALRGRKGGE